MPPLGKTFALWRMEGGANVITEEKNLFFPPILIFWKLKVTSRFFWVFFDLHAPPPLSLAITWGSHLSNWTRPFLKDGIWGYMGQLELGQSLLHHHPSPVPPSTHTEELGTERQQDRPAISLATTLHPRCQCRLQNHLFFLTSPASSLPSHLQIIVLSSRAPFALLCSFDGFGFG